MEEKEVFKSEATAHLLYRSNVPGHRFSFFPRHEWRESDRTIKPNTGSRSLLSEQSANFGLFDSNDSDSNLANSERAGVKIGTVELKNKDDFEDEIFEREMTPFEMEPGFSLSTEASNASKDEIITEDSTLKESESMSPTGESEVMPPINEKMIKEPTVTLTIENPEQSVNNNVAMIGEPETASPLISMALLSTAQKELKTALEVNDSIDIDENSSNTIDGDVIVVDLPRDDSQPDADQLSFLPETKMSSDAELDLKETNLHHSTASTSSVPYLPVSQAWRSWETNAEDFSWMNSDANNLVLSNPATIIISPQPSARQQAFAPTPGKNILI